MSPLPHPPPVNCLSSHTPLSPPSNTTAPFRHRLRIHQPRSSRPQPRLPAFLLAKANPNQLLSVRAGDLLCMGSLHCQAYRPSTSRSSQRMCASGSRQVPIPHLSTRQGSVKQTASILPLGPLAAAHCPNRRSPVHVALAISDTRPSHLPLQLALGVQVRTAAEGISQKKVSTRTQPSDPEGPSTSTH